MKNHCCKIATSAGVAVAIGYTLCALFTHVHPQTALNLTAQLMHLNSVEPLAHYAPFLQVTTSNYISGVTQSFAYAFGLVWLGLCVHHHIFKGK